MVVEERNLPNVLGHGGRKLAARGLVAKEHVTDGICRLASTEPHVKDGREGFVLPSHDRRTAREVEQHDGLAELLQFKEHVALCVRHVEVRTATALAAHL